MDEDPLTSFLTPPLKRQKVGFVHPSPSRYSDLLAAFGVKASLGSISKMARESLRSVKTPFSYAESDGSVPSPQESPTSSFHGSPEKHRDDVDSEDELQDGNDESEDDPDDVIEVAPRRQTVRELPKRSAKKRISYNTHKRGKYQKRSTRGISKPVKLTSDLTTTSSTRLGKPQTQRNIARHDISDKTKPKRNTFLLHSKDYFLPLLPGKNYISKLQHLSYQNDEDEPDTVPYANFTSQPDGVLATMKPYQLEGLSFLVYMYKNGMSAILGDEMGLGKTLQTLSLFQYLKTQEPTRGENRPFLVVCPLSVLSSWMNEAKKWVPHLNVIRFHGPKKERQQLKEDCRRKSVKIDVLLTTYETFVAEKDWFKRSFVWRYCVLDEGHKVKNNKSDVSQALQSLQAEYRLLLTGTPLQNNLLEMWALLHWLYPEVFTQDTADKFKRAFDLTKGKVSTSFMDDARRLLELVMLRRMKSSPGVNLGLPPKEEVLLYVPLTPMQRFWYTRFLTKADNILLEELFKDAKGKEVNDRLVEAEEDSKQSDLLNQAAAALANPGRTTDDVWAESKEIMEKAIQNEEAGDDGSQWRKLMNLILQLRKVCSHPYILPHAAPDPYYLGEHVKTASGKFIVLDKLVSELVVKQKKKILVFAGMTKTLDLVEDLLYLKGGNATINAAFRYLRFDGGTTRARRNLGIRMFNDPESDHRIFLISTRAGGLGINLASASDVVFMDEDWNPQITIQAEARAHRIGQTQKVTVYKLCTAGTVEEQMMGRIRKKLYLSAKITESMRNIHSQTAGQKRKRGTSTDTLEDDAPHLDTTSLKTLIRRGAQTLTRPEVDVTEMLDWDWQTTLDKCKDQPIDTKAEDDDAGEQEQSWLNSMEKVECAVFEGKKHQKEIDNAARQSINLTRADRRVGKNTTVMIDGFAINKESLNCADWEAVPTMAGKDPRLAEPVKAKKKAIEHQEHCQHCWDDGSLVLCKGCPRSYHLKCLDETFQSKSKGMAFFCPQHECVDCQAKTADAGGLIYRCRWCEKGYCEDCLDWDAAKIVGATLPEHEILGSEAMDNAWFVECPSCLAYDDSKWVEQRRAEMDGDYQAWLASSFVTETSSVVDETPATISEIGTPAAVDFDVHVPKKLKVF